MCECVRDQVLKVREQDALSTNRLLDFLRFSHLGAVGDKDELIRF